MLLRPFPGGDAAVVENPSTLWLSVLGIATGPLGGLLAQAAPSACTVSPSLDCRHAESRSSLKSYRGTVRSREMACCRSSKARSSSCGLTREAARTLSRAPRIRA